MSDDAESGAGSDPESGDAETVEAGSGADEAGSTEDDTGQVDDDTAPVVDEEEVRHVASLARVDLDDDEVEAFAAQFADILADFEELDEVPEVEREADLVNVMRPDEVREGLSQEEALANAPESDEGFFKGPRVS